jgi:S1-C subfamily serine protease
VDGHLAGSGFFASEDGLGLTAEHVLGAGAKAKKIEILHPKVGRYPATLVAIDAGHDLALIRVEIPKGQKTAFLPIRSDTPKPGERIWLFGTPIFRHAVLLEGGSARPDTVFEWLGNEQRYHEVFYTSAMSPTGTSGGVWIDSAGRAAGLQSGMIVVQNAPQGVGFTIAPAAMAKLLAEKKNARTPWLGLAGDELWENKERIKEFPAGSEGMVVTVVISGGPAAQAGIVEGSLITKAGGKSVRYRDDVLRAARALKPGDGLKMELLLPNHPDPAHAEIELGCIEDNRK